MRKVLATAMLLVFGCSSGEIARVEVAGRVRYRGQAVRGGIIAFTPDKERGTTGDGARADLDSAGGFRVPDGGLRPGWYRITVASLETALPDRYRDADLANIAREVVAGQEMLLEITLDE